MLLGQKIGKTNGLGQKALGVAKKVGKVATGASVVGSALLAVRAVGGDQNVRQVGRLLAPGIQGLARNAMM
tara:strand:- start:5143 stop:5355 length:213 start_codon:yes stop_codon:yes gene_type:complete